MTTFIVHGPKACGKTRARHWIARHLTGDASRFVEMDELSAKPQADHVHLTYDRHATIAKLERAGFRTYTVMAFADLPIPAMPEGAD